MESAQWNGLENKALAGLNREMCTQDIVDTQRYLSKKPERFHVAKINIYLFYLISV